MSTYSSMKRLKKKKSEKAQLLKQGLADARKKRVRKAKEDYTKHVPREKPLSETNPYMRDPKLRKKMILEPHGHNRRLS